MTPSCFYLATRVKEKKIIHKDRKRKKEKKKNYYLSGRNFQVMWLKAKA